MYKSSYQIHHKEIPVINGLVLCGGQSTRMGKDKGELFYYEKNQRLHLYEMLSVHCKTTFISCNAEQSKNITDLPKIEDAFLNSGPISGILSAFQHNQNVAWLIVACDLPFLNAETTSYLINNRNPLKMATAFRNEETKFPEPLITIWEPKAFPLLMNFFKHKHKSPAKFLLNADIELLTVPNISALKNVNTTNEYKEVISLLKNQE